MQSTVLSAGCSLPLPAKTQSRNNILAPGADVYLERALLPVESQKTPGTRARSVFPAQGVNPRKTRALRMQVQLMRLPKRNGAEWNRGVFLVALGRESIMSNSNNMFKQMDKKQLMGIRTVPSPFGRGNAPISFPGIHTAEVCCM